MLAMGAQVESTATTLNVFRLYLFTPGKLPGLGLGNSAFVSKYFPAGAAMFEFVDTNGAPVGKGHFGRGISNVNSLSHQCAALDVSTDAARIINGQRDEPGYYRDSDHCNDERIAAHAESFKLRCHKRSAID